MKVTASDKSCAYGDPGVFRGTFRFENPILADYVWPICEIRGKVPGPRLCISAGVHVNEVSSIEAAVRLQNLFDPETLKGTVSIVPLINQPAAYKYCEYVCPVDGKNINHTFPGKRDGTFSEALCDAVLREWTAGADCYIDMHGGDLKEKVSKFSIFQKTGEAEFDDLARRIAMCFDSEIVLALTPEYMSKPGRPPTACALRKQVGIMTEAGSNGLLSEDDIAFHVEGVLNVSRLLGMTDSAVTLPTNARKVCDTYIWVDCPADGEFHAKVEPGIKVERGQRLGLLRNLFGDTLAELTAPVTGFVLWRITHPSIRKGEPVLTIVEEERPG
ncbi:succinylglutamate desuccinylase/aspartoacylase family protein [Sinorhizobium sp. 7-81]|uniref:succinylglutamate desuccinylase/aspartoacylase domain-containing protein n=1 Tax=Sinorhizobium sp. 8-89 TaxID=3049089 RepID=UPI0024C3AEEF|nr:succinylglutamate desuccinylase/aspartoacylase family protein [Sinorhizobium sp. 8-89]MDK1494301.1 succinylglutamate desuccinylase/aspartoacylase family protein [Sinorhizobium sp. 8-89]